jgi:hypothetical protein
MGYHNDQNHPGAGTLAADEYRGNMGQVAALLLDLGVGANCLSTDHSGAAELCVETIVRKQFDISKKQINMAGMANAQQASVNLKTGLGVHKAQGDHAGGNTCAAVLAGAR